MLLAVMGLLAACVGPPATPWPTYTPYPTATPAPTPTPWPTYTPYPTATPFPTATPQPTYTPYPTPTPAPAPTPTPQPTATLGVLVNEPEAAPGYTLFGTLGGDAYYLIDRQGRVVQRWPAPGGARLAKLLENGNLLTSGYGTQGHNRNGVRAIDPEGKVVWRYRFPRWHHDFLPLPNGNMLLLGEQRKSNGEVIALGANSDYLGNTGLRGTHLVEVRPTPPEGGEVVWEWSSWDHIIQGLDPEKPNYGVVADHPELIDLNYPLNIIQDGLLLVHGDWQHTNSLAYHPELEQIMVSVRHFGEIWVIDRSTTTEEAAGHSGGKGGKGGDLLYRWGNPRAWQMGTVADQQLFGLHNAHWIEPGLPGAGNVLVFNNGWEFELRRGYSSVDELRLPAEGYNYQRESGKPYGPERPEWTFHDVIPADFYSGNMGCAQRLPNGNTLFCYSRNGTLWEVTPAGRTVWKYVNPVLLGGPARQGDLLGRRNDDRVYRAYHYPPDYPGLAELDLTPGEPLELPALP